jgi:hypothetical protein
MKKNKLNKKATDISDNSMTANFKFSTNDNTLNTRKQGFYVREKDKTIKRLE